VLAVAVLLAFYLAWNLGANDVANAMGTAVGSKAITLRQALVIAGVLEFLGAVLFGQAVTENLALGIIDPVYFAPKPQTLVLAMLAVLLATGLWMNLATWFGLPVSSSHAAVGGVVGVGLVAIGPAAIDWQNLGGITVTWLCTPLFSGLLAGIGYVVLRSMMTGTRLAEWIPWLSALLVGLFSVIVLPTIVSDRRTSLGIAGLASSVLTFFLLTEWSEKPEPEALFGRLQVLTAGFVAFAHGSNDVGNAIAPLATILSIQSTGQVPTENLAIPLWVLAIGGAGIVGGLLVWGEKVMTTIGTLIPLQPSAGFSAELATVVMILLASRLGLPVSTSHALVGAVVGVGVAQGVKIEVDMLKSIGFTWVATVPLAAGLAALIFLGLRLVI
jgi:inorganic phosphate transporter, PiT family